MRINKVQEVKNLAICLKKYKRTNITTSPLECVFAGSTGKLAGKRSEDGEEIAGRRHDGRRNEIV